MRGLVCLVVLTLTLLGCDRHRPRFNPSDASLDRAVDVAVERRADAACVPQCGLNECGPDPVCGESCGVCDNGLSCAAGRCGSADCFELPNTPPVRPACSAQAVACAESASTEEEALICAMTEPSERLNACQQCLRLVRGACVSARIPDPARRGAVGCALACVSDRGADCSDEPCFRRVVTECAGESGSPDRDVIAAIECLQSFDGCRL